MRERFVMVSLLTTAATATAAPVSHGIGRAPRPDELRAVDISIAPDGLGLPVGHGSSADGAALYQAMCMACHGPSGEGLGDFPTLVGGVGSLRTAKPVLTVGSYWPYATTLWDYIRRAMPYLTPGALTANDVYALTAYILQLNGVIEPDTVLTDKTLSRVRMPNRDGFVADPRPDVRVRPR
jgi:cytochrome c